MPSWVLTECKNPSSFIHQVGLEKRRTSTLELSQGPIVKAVISKNEGSPRRELQTA